jgi:mannose-1-phosphate guanylyltransferase
VRVIPLAYAWNDVGSWAALPLPEVLERREENWAAGGTRLLAEDARDCVVYGRPGTLTALIGVSDLVVVHAGGATLVCPRDRAQEIKRIVERLGAEAPEFL